MKQSYVADLRQQIGQACIHLPGVRAIILNDKNEVLLQRRADMNCWGLPAGAVELDETAYDALRREVLEETALTVQSAVPVALYSGPSQRFCYPNGDQVQGFAVSFVVLDWTGQPRPDGIEGTELRFWPLSGLPEDLVPIHAMTLWDYNKKYHGRFMVSDISTKGVLPL